MSARTWALGFVCSLVGVSAGVTMACSSKPVQNSTSSPDDPSNESDPDSGAGAKSGNWQDEDVTTEADAGTKGSGPSCSPTAVDDPDDSFADTNCDGIDGDKNRAIFVATTGSDTAVGSISMPVATLTHGIGLAIAAKKDVYVCKGNYAEPTIQLATAGVRIYGGYDCTKAWRRNSSSEATLASTSTTAVNVTGVTGAVVFDHIDITAASGTSGGDTSMAVFVSNSSNVTLRRGTYTAGSGANAAQPSAPAPATNGTPACYAYVYPNGCYGEPGTNAYQYADCFYNNQIGSAYYMTAAKLGSGDVEFAKLSDYPSSNTCKGGLQSYGGQGGGTNANNLQVGNNGTPGVPASTTGTLDGADGGNGQSGANATQSFGTLSTTGYVASNTGVAGQSGQLGQAGTGGNGGGMAVIYSAGAGDFPYYLFAPRAGGGTGGFGGCPGDGGQGGSAGGASIAVGIYQSSVTLDRLTLTTANGGNGSAGALGGDGVGGQPGGVCGVAHYECGSCAAEEASACPSIAITNTTSAQSGGKGGKGGSGGQGGPGAGGPSIPLVVAGTAPALSAVTFLPGSGGIGGSNGGPRAADGESMDQKVLP